jgi:hypothetical protein
MDRTTRGRGRLRTMPRYLLIRLDGGAITTGDYDSDRPWEVGDTLTGELEGFEVVLEQRRELGSFDGLLVVKK